jgi:hypothetical protein
MKRCSVCQSDKPVEEFYVRKTGSQAGTTLGICITCNADLCRYRDYQRRLKAGTLDALIADLEHKLSTARRVIADADKAKRDALALELGRKLLSETDQQSGGEITT